jgi:hypothetical protein
LLSKQYPQYCTRNSNDENLNNGNSYKSLSIIKSGY